MHFGIGPLAVRSELPADATADTIRDALADFDMSDDLHASAAYRRHLAVGARRAGGRKGARVIAITLTVNGDRQRARGRAAPAARRRLRDDLALTGTHVGCEHGVCGAARYCWTRAGASVPDARSPGGRRRLRPSKASRRPTDASPAAGGVPAPPRAPVRILHSRLPDDGVDLLPRRAHRAREIRDALAGHLCRCTGYVRIVGAVRAAAALGEHRGMSFGDRIQRKEDRRLLTGDGRYPATSSCPGRTSRSFAARTRMPASCASTPSSRGSIPAWWTWSRSPTWTAAAVPLPSVPVEPALRDRNFSLLANDRVRYVGELVAAVVARDRYVAEDAASASGRVRAVAGRPNWRRPRRARRPRRPPGQRGRPADVAHGDVDAALARPHVSARRLVIERSAEAAEGRAASCADYRGGLLTVWASSQVPHQIRQFISHVLGVASHEVRSWRPTSAAASAPSSSCYPEDVLVPFLAMRLGQPVQWHRGPARAHGRRRRRSACRSTRSTVGLDARAASWPSDDFVHDNGAYSPRGLIVPGSPRRAVGALSHPEHRGHDFTSCFTNRVPRDALSRRRPPAGRLRDRACARPRRRALGRDRAAVRRNLMSPYEMPYDVGLPLSATRPAPYLRRR